MSSDIGVMGHIKSYLRAMSENSFSGKIYSLPEEYIFDGIQTKIENLWTNFKSEENEKGEKNSLLNRAGALTGAALLSLAWVIARAVTVAFTITGIILGSIENGLRCLSHEHREKFMKSYNNHPLSRNERTHKIVEDLAKKNATNVSVISSMPVPKL